MRTSRWLCNVCERLVKLDLWWRTTWGRFKYGCSTNQPQLPNRTAPVSLTHANSLPSDRYARQFPRFFDRRRRHALQEVFAKTYLPEFWAVVVNEAKPGDGGEMSSDNADAFVRGLEVSDPPSCTV